MNSVQLRLSSQDLEETRKLFGRGMATTRADSETPIIRIMILQDQDKEEATAKKRCIVSRSSKGKDSARDFLMGQVRNIQTGVSQGRFDKEQAALQLAALQELIERVDEGKLGTEASDNEEFFKQLLAQLDSKPMVNNIQITIDPKNIIKGSYLR